MSERDRHGEFDTFDQHAVIKVCGIGGGGCNSVDRMIEAGLSGVQFIAINTDAQSLKKSKAEIRVQIGTKSSNGLGAGANPEAGRAACEEDRDEVRTVLQGADMVFLALGLGGGTGTGAAPIVAEEAMASGALVCAIVSKRTVSIVMAVLAIALQAFWQYPFFYQPSKLPRAAVAAASGETVNTDDGYARLMTCNVYKGRADAREIVDLVRSEHVEVLALQETTDAFVDDLNRAGIASYLPYAQVSSSDGVYGNGLWSASPLDDPSDDDVDSSASFMPGGTVSFNGGATQVRFVSVHTTSPTNDYWQQWKRSLDELAKLRFDTSRRYVFMGDFNATYDHTPFRNILGNRFSDASRQAGEGLKFSWPANVDYVPSFAGIDHIVLDSGMQAGQVRTVKVDGSDHKALLAIVRVG